MIEFILGGIVFFVLVVLFKTSFDLFSNGLVWLRDWVLDKTLGPEDPFDCRGCHEGDFSEFDHFCDVLNVTDDEVSDAFAAFLAHKTEWDGDYGPIDQSGVV